MIWAVIGLMIVGCVVVCLRLGALREARTTDGEGSGSVRRAAKMEAARKILRETKAPVDEASGPAEPDAADAAEEAPEAAAEEETEEDRAEKLVDAFDELTDRWQEPAAAKVTMEEIRRFHDQFAKVPPARRDECIHRALNLVPDENVMLLAGILLDKAQDKEILEAVYNDILNRDEEVKRPILQEIFKDKEHPCWADTAWILDVTGDLPQKP